MYPSHLGYTEEKKWQKKKGIKRTTVLIIPFFFCHFLNINVAFFKNFIGYLIIMPCYTLNNWTRWDLPAKTE
ncbi:hypothetical protein COT99_01020 [Candidatus Falkowbacteria bacterium CG10_big_fil_rev_8_21_14_0_10_43_10]|uniref:Uncharacterized protein n=1 Tax=Candidatus Falkowbacteria bacterium CG10_big_fil_rev_8_21_14_0_10_43_10 TaxID=1974567 RepID=A0A2H0V2R8_9BACT|nr:MAG: hypothetical protein COT99_01020 [Candidatus Falkowbacteria bacterium CG10_big_fil_rev_8_21_14_0_10_43_10]